jgi:hypothetical protein
MSTPGGLGLVCGEEGKSGTRHWVRVGRRACGAASKDISGRPGGALVLGVWEPESVPSGHQATQPARASYLGAALRWRIAMQGGPLATCCPGHQAMRSRMMHLL